MAIKTYEGVNEFKARLDALLVEFQQQCNLSDKAATPDWETAPADLWESFWRHLQGRANEMQAKLEQTRGRPAHG